MDCGNKENRDFPACPVKRELCFEKVLPERWLRRAKVNQSPTEVPPLPRLSEDSLKGGFDTECFSDFAALCCLCRLLSDDDANLFWASSRRRQGRDDLAAGVGE